MNKKVRRLVQPSVVLYFVVMGLFCVAAVALRQYILAAAEAGVTLVLLGVTYLRSSRRKRALAAYVQSTSELMERLSHIAAELACDTARAIEAGTAGRTPQEESKATYAPMLSKAMSPIDWSECGQYVIDHVRGLIPWPVATAELDGKTFKIFRVEKTEKTTDKAPGTLLALTRRGLEVACGGGTVVLVEEVQAQGGKRMPAPDYFRGHPITI